MNILDDDGKIKQLDTLNMLAIEENFADQLAEAQKIGAAADITGIRGRNFAGIAFLGMGGSGFTGDIIKSLLINRSEIPIVVIKGYSLPAYVSRDWLVISLSYSGNTEETLTATEEALKRDCEIIFISSGGSAEKIAQEKRKCIIKIPGGFQPRAASGYLMIPLLVVLNKIGLSSVTEKEIGDAVKLIDVLAKEYNRNIPFKDNPAKQLAAGIGNFLPVIYSFESELSPVAYRWKCQINENSKTPAFFNEFPELNHNETVGWERLKNITKEFVLIYFIDKEAPERINARIKITVELIKYNFADTIEIDIKGKTPIEKVLSTIFLGGIASVYLALLNGVDPTPIDKINTLKTKLAEL
ncbi:MAG TPA: bifunctional phosphoglucose/phosphomannose isomerase [Actinobacteria bacterium]|nr:bifunctional phosphoglucose/phosphomannose isomerase [Actinomycetota bacterium]